MTASALQADRALVNGTPRAGGFPPSGFDPLRSAAVPREIGHEDGYSARVCFSITTTFLNSMTTMMPQRFVTTIIQRNAFVDGTAC